MKYTVLIFAAALVLASCQKETTSSGVTPTDTTPQDTVASEGCTLVPFAGEWTLVSIDSYNDFTTQWEPIWGYEETNEHHEYTFPFEVCIPVEPAPIYDEQGTITVEEYNDGEYSDTWSCSLWLAYTAQDIPNSYEWSICGNSGFGHIEWVSDEEYHWMQSSSMRWVFLKGHNLY